MKNKKVKYIFVSGGVCSSLGKGISTASLGLLLEGHGYKISIIKMDPYINIDPGTMSPYQHGEVYVTEDGAETDLDLGYYERFTGAELTKKHAHIPLGRHLYMDFSSKVTPFLQKKCNIFNKHTYMIVGSQ